MDDIISHSTEEYKALDSAMRIAQAELSKLLAEHHHPTIQGERYLTSEQVCLRFHISKRALQKYRDN